MLLFTSTYAKQLGFSALTVGSVFTLMPVVGMIGKLVVGALSDKLQAHKQIVIVLLTISITCYYSMMYIPPIQKELLSEIYCDSSTNISLKLCTMKDLNEEENGCDPNYSTTAIGCQMRCLVDQDLLETECDKLEPHLSNICNHSRRWSLAAVLNTTSRISTDKSSSVGHEALLLKTSILKTSMRRMETDNAGVCTTFSVMSMEDIPRRNLLNSTLCSQNAVRVASCRMVCDSPLLTDIGTLVEKKHITQEYQLWVFSLLLVLGGVGASIVVSLSDTMTFALLGESSSEFGKIRLWGSVGWGIFAMVGGKMIDEFSDGTPIKNYSPAFISTAIILSLDALLVSSLNTVVKKKAKSIALDVGKVLLNIETIIFLCWCVSVGACLGITVGFFFWYIEDLSSCEDTASIKTLEGLYVILQTFLGELPFFFLNAWVCKKLGLVNCMSLMLFLYGVVFLTISSLNNPWHFLPVALINGMTFSTLYSVMTSYANNLALPGTETTIQSLVGSVYEGIGLSSGNFIAGLMMNNMKGGTVFRIFGITMLILCAVHCILHCIISRNSRKRETFEKKKGSTHPTVEYSKPSEMSAV
ncbi:major facilitator superfamily domain-containing protein 6-A isoform X2 [Nilaparvata lugens]|nr:major facilitator superfamily domain-containing protein 6-A isoform X2 [Nilaparvata lugens]